MNHVMIFGANSTVRIAIGNHVYIMFVAHIFRCNAIACVPITGLFFLVNGVHALNHVMIYEAN